MQQTDSYELAKLLVDDVIDTCVRDDTSLLSATITMACHGKQFSNIIMALALVLSDIIDDIDEPKRSAIAMSVGLLALRAAKAAP